MIQVAMTDRPRPSHPMCSSQSFRFQMRDCGVPRGTVAPGTKMRQMTAMMMMGAMTEMTVAIQTGTVSLTVKGKLQRGRQSAIDHTWNTAEATTHEISGSKSEKGRLFGDTWPMM